MRNKFEYILLSLLIGLSVLLGLSFWLNTRFGFNLFYKEHWDELAKLQATNIPVNQWFYISICIALFLFILGLIAIYIPLTKQNTPKKQDTEKNVILPASILTTQNKEKDIIPEPIIPVTRPPHLNLPKNIKNIVVQKHENHPDTILQNAQINSGSKQYDNILANIFTENGYLVKPSPVISGFTPNLFAIGNGENLWIGGVDCKIENLQNAVIKLNSVFKETLEDIIINIHAFLIDNSNKYNQQESINVFHSIDDLKKFIMEHPIEPISDDEQENFNAYSEYIDTIIQYIKNL